MAWKKKEKELGQEEAVRLARAALEPFWFWSEPLIAAMKTPEGRVVAIPLDPSFQKKTWLIVFLDPMDFGGEGCFQYFSEWKRRFADQDISFLVILRMPYVELRNSRAVHKLMEAWKIQTPTALDADGLLGRAFEALDLPAVVLMQKGKFVFARMGKSWGDGTEAEIQQFLRISDPGLPLRPPFASTLVQKETVQRLEFGSQAPEAWRFPYPPGAFREAGDGRRIGEFRGDLPRELLASPHQLIGRWTCEVDRIVTDDPESALLLRSPGSCLSIVAMSLSKTTDPARLWVDVNGGPVYDSIQGEHLSASDDGQGVVVLKELRLYHLLENLPEGAREVTLRFPGAKTEPLALYGVRFGK